MNSNIDNQLEIGSVIDGKYRIDDLLGQGGMGMVFRVTHVQLKKTFALKVMLFDKAKDDADRANRLARFKREAEVLARISHPNIVMVTDFGAVGEEQLPYIVMEFIEGTTLRKYAMAQGEVSLDFALDVAKQICAGLHAAHAQGIVHRDLKPENVMLQFLADGDVMARVLDFGIAKLAPDGSEGTEALTTDGPGLGSPGTPKYMAPEQIFGHPVDVRADVFAICLMVYELLTKNLPTVLLADPKPLEKFRQDIPLQLDTIIRKGLSKLPEERQQTALELRRELDALEQSVAAETLLRDRLTPSRGQAALPTTPGFEPVTISNRALTQTILVDQQPAPSGGGAFKWVAVMVLAAGGIGGWFFYPQISSALGLGKPGATKNGLPSAAMPTFVEFPGGNVTIGSDRGDMLSRPEHPEKVSPFAVSGTLVTNRQYLEFVKRTSHNPPTTWNGPEPAPKDAEKPVTGVSWNDAVSYCQWLSKETGKSYRLISEKEWEYLARNSDRRGMKDLLNGFLEWTRDSQTAYPGSTKVKPDTGLRIFRGRPEDHPEEEKTFRFPQKPDFTYELLGFRIVQEAGGGGQ